MISAIRTRQGFPIVVACLFRGGVIQPQEMPKEPKLEDAGASFWEIKTLEPEASACWRLGPLSLWARRRNNEWGIFAERGGSKELVQEFAGGTPPREDAAWKRWAFKQEESAVGLVPTSPDRSVVARPETPLRIPPDNDVLLFVSVPLWLRVFVGGERRVFLVEEPTRVLSNTWFGEPTEGELCYALKTGASRSLAGVKAGTYRFVCPLLIKNHSAEELNFQKVCLPVPHVQLYRGKTRIWSNRISLSYLGKSQFSAVVFDGEPPEYEEIREKLGEPRIRERRSFVRRSFETIRTWGSNW